MIPLQDLEDLWQWSRRLQATHVEADEACLCNTVRDAAPQPHEEALAAAFSIWD
jgi:hypothetical protein